MIFPSSITDRYFWIYFIITLFFIIIGLTSLLPLVPPYISFLWLLANIALLIIIYHTSSVCAPIDEHGGMVCVVDATVQTCGTNSEWWLINVLFALLLIASVMWGAEDMMMNGILILILALGLFVLIRKRMIAVTWTAYIIYITIWFILTFWLIIPEL